jgi:hypothetical protein
MRAAIAALLALILSVTAAHAQPVPAPGCPLSGCTYTGALTAAASGTGLAVTNNETVGGTLGVTGLLTATGGITAPSSSALVLTGGGSSTTTQIKNGPNGGGALMLELGGSSQSVAPQTDIALPGGTWGSGTLVNNVAPIYQNETFAGSTTNAQAGFGAFLQQTDNSSNTLNGTGLTENLILNGSGVFGYRAAGSFVLTINAGTGNTVSQAYTGLTGKCQMNATDSNITGGGGSVCFGGNFVGTVAAGVTTAGVTGVEIDTGEGIGSVPLVRVGLGIVDLNTVNGSSTTGVQGSQDDVALALNNQYAPSSTAGFLNGLEFGRYGGNFPVATNGTLIFGQGAHGIGFTVANGIDWHLGTATGYWYKYGSVASMDGSGNQIVNSTTATTFDTATNCSSSASPAVCASAAAGSIAVPTGTNPTLEVDTSAVTANSQILLTVDESLGTKLSVTCNTTISTLAPAVVTARTAATSFTVEIGATVATNPVCLSYYIVN